MVLEKQIIPLQITSGVFEIRPDKRLFLNARRPIQLTPKKTYKAFLTTNEKYPVVIVLEKEGRLRYFPVLINYAKNNFTYQAETSIPNQEEWLDKFNQTNEHIRDENKQISLENI